MDNDQSRGQDSVYSNKVRAGKRRTYFFDVRQTKGEDFYITLTESTKRFNGDGYSRHKLFLYKEDFNRFMEGLQDVVDHVKNDLMPDYDYEQFDRRQEEWDKQQALNKAAEANAEEEISESEPIQESSSEATVSEDSIDDDSAPADIEEDMSW